MLSFDLTTDTELRDVVGLFYGDERPTVEMSGGDGEYSISVDGNPFSVKLDGRSMSEIPPAHRNGRLAKIALYDALSSYTGRSMPWGALTGVRPTKLFYECLKNGNSAERAVDVMRTVYRVSAERAEVLRRIVAAQSGKVFFAPEYINLYVHIPYCTTRCSYCSFVSLPIKKYKEQADAYAAALCEEIRRSVEFLQCRGKKILSVYIGGGTPTAICADALDAVLSSIGRLNVEYTCEAGRPDTITEEKLDMMRAHGVNRVCVNPQSLCDATLEEIGRSHTVDDFYRAFDAVRARGFDINCDLIAGLGSESAAQFRDGFDKIISLRPENITVHTLSKKNGSGIRYERGENSAAAEMAEHALGACGEYRPYYLYRQKRQAGNLENVGFSLIGKECVNNITTMEETVGVMACGAGAISKAVCGGNITRFANMRDVPLYLSRFEEKLSAKLDAIAAAFDC